MPMWILRLREEAKDKKGPSDCFVKFPKALIKDGNVHNNSEGITIRVL